MIKKIFIVISFFILVAIFFSDEYLDRIIILTANQMLKTDQKTTRGSGGKILKSKIKTDIEIFKKNLIKRTKAKNYSNLLSASATNISKRIKTRRGGPFILNFPKLLFISETMRTKMLAQVF